MPEPANKVVGCSLVLSAVLFSGSRVPGVTPAMEPGIQVARRLLQLFLTIMVVSFVHAIWATFISGTDLPLQPIALRGGVKREKAGATLHLTPEMNPLRLLFRRKIDARSTVHYYVTVADSAGNLIARSTPGDYGSSSPKQPFNEGTSQLDVFEVPVAGAYKFEVETEQGEEPTPIQNAAVGVRQNAHDSHFFLTTLLLSFAAWLAAKWWRRQYGWIVDRLSGSVEAAWAKSLAAATALPESAAGPVRFRLRPALGSPQSAAGTGPEPVSPPSWPEELKAPETPFAWLRQRLILEAWSLALSAVQIPIVGAYTMLVLIVGVSALAGTAPGTLDALMKSPVTITLLGWLFPKGHYEGFDAFWQMGQAGGVLLLVFHLAMMPIRALWPVRRRTFGEKTKLLFKANLALLAVATVSFLVSGNPIGKALDGVTVCAILQVFLFVPAVILLGIGTKLQAHLDASQTQAVH